MQQNDKLYGPRKSNECMCGCGENEESEGREVGALRKKRKKKNPTLFMLKRGRGVFGWGEIRWFKIICSPSLP